MAQVLTLAATGAAAEAREVMGAPDRLGGAASRLTDALISWLRVIESDNLTELQERRSSRRITAKGGVTVRKGDRSLPGRVEDLSEGGLLAATDRGMELAAGDRVEVILPIAGSALRLHAEVVRAVDPSQCGGNLALTFVGIPAASARQLRDHLAALGGE